MKKLLLYFLLSAIIFSLPTSMVGQKIYYQPPSGGSGSGITQAQGDSLYWRLNGNTNISVNNFLGTTDAKNLVFKTNNVMRATILSTGFVGINTSSPGYRLDVDASAGGNPLRLRGLQSGSLTTDYVLTSLNGVVRFVLASDFVYASIAADNQLQALGLGVTSGKYFYATVTNTMGMTPGTVIKQNVY